jgi:predicted CoA-binding protein
MNNPAELLRESKSILLIDWPSRDVPDSLARAGHEVVVQGGPEPDHYNEYVATDGQVDVRYVGHAPEHADLVYSYRPIDELPEIADQARNLGAQAVWVQLPADESSNVDQARSIVEGAGLRFIDAPILEAIT